MNLNAAPTKAELRGMLELCNDRSAHHVLWVDKNGDVHVSPLPKDLTPAGFQQTQPSMQLRYETFEQGNEYVGPAAAADDEWVSRLFDSLRVAWPKIKDKKDVEYIDNF